MKRTDLVRYLASQGCRLLREGGRHSVFWNPANRMTSAIPRHSEIVDPVARRICKDLGIPWLGGR
jgi:mRNA interferase HicA